MVKVSTITVALQLIGTAWYALWFKAKVTRDSWPKYPDWQIIKTPWTAKFNSSCQIGDEEICAAPPHLTPEAAKQLFRGDLNLSLDEMQRIYGDDMEFGGYYRPEGCRPRGRIAIIIPFRNRDEHLRHTLQRLIPYLKWERLEFMIVVIEQMGDPNAPFNRAMLLNIGYVEANHLANRMGLPGWCCYAFHDVDRHPVNGLHTYRCPRTGLMWHMSGVSPYLNHFGGVGVINGAEFESINGFSNLYFGYGAEDDEISLRGVRKGYEVQSAGKVVSRDAVLGHVHVDDVPREYYELNNYWLAGSVRLRMSIDGLNCLKYHVARTTPYRTHTQIQVKFTKNSVHQYFFAKCSNGLVAKSIARMYKFNFKQMIKEYRGSNDKVIDDTIAAAFHQRDSQGQLVLVNKENLTWTEAREECNMIRGCLAVLKTAASHQAALNLIGNAEINKPCSSPIMGYWVGARAEKPRGKYVWSDGTAMSADGWYPGQPDRFGCSRAITGTSCVRLIPGGWDDLNCNDAYTKGAICEVLRS